MSKNLSTRKDVSIPVNPAVAVLPQPFSSFQFLIGSYDDAINACDKNNFPGAKSSILDLMSSLEVPHTRSANRLFVLYQFCLARLDSGDFQETMEILKVIKEAWFRLANFENGPAARA